MSRSAGVHVAAPTALDLPGLTHLATTDPELLAFASSVTATSDDLLLVLAEEPAHAHRSADLVRSARSADGLAVLVGSGSWSRWLLLVSTVAQHATEYPVGVVASVADDLLAEIETRVHLGSVAKLRDPSPGLARHAASWLPNARFVTDLQSVDRQTGAADPPAGHGPAVVLHSADARSRAWAEELAPTGASRIEVDGHGGWHSRAWAEVSWWPRPPAEVLAATLARTRRADCRWCGRTVAATRTCTYCGFTPESRADSESRGDRA